MLLSDNSDSRIRHFNRNIGAKYIAEAGKPEPEAFLKAVKMLGIRKAEAVVIGDQVFKDILGANRAGLKSILVKYIGYYKKDKKGIRRRLENIILFFYKRSRKYTHRLGKITMKENCNNAHTG